MRQKRLFLAPLHTPEQPELFATSLEDLVPPDHIARALKEAVSQLDLSHVLDLYDDKGGYPFDPRAMLGLLLFALMDGERSSRRIQEHCRFDLRYRYLCGARIPDDRTICRFRRRLAPVLPGLFKQVLDMARAKGRLGMKVVALDGTKVEGSISQWRSVLDEAEREDAADPDCRTMVSRRGRLNGYNVQAAVDADSGLVTAADVTQSATDFQELSNAVERIEASAGRLPEALVADRGYESAENADYLEKKGVEPCLHPKKQDADFWSFDEQGQIVCPKGSPLVPRDHFVRFGRRTTRLYVRQCPGCSHRPGCHSSKHKHLSFPSEVDPSARIRNAHRCRSPEGRRILARRGPAVETLFGQLKWNKGFRRFRHRGLAMVRAEFHLECLAHNLEKLLRSDRQAA